MSDVVPPSEGAGGPGASAREREIEVDGRTVGVSSYGDSGDAVLWCHGGPGNRRQPAEAAAALVPAGFRLVGIDRPGYGASDPWPDRRIGDWVSQGIAVADHLGIDRFAAVGVSTGGAYALALAARHPDRVTGVVACCAVTDMRWDGAREGMSADVTDVWDAPDRSTALHLVTDTWGHDGSKMLERMAAGDAPPLPQADIDRFADPSYLAALLDGSPLSFRQGVEGYVDDRRADGPGWASIDLSAVACPVIVLHGESDTIVPVAHAHHTASIVPGARLDLRAGQGHFSIGAALPDSLLALRDLATPLP